MADSLNFFDLVLCQLFSPAIWITAAKEVVPPFSLRMVLFNVCSRHLSNGKPISYIRWQIMISGEVKPFKNSIYHFVGRNKQVLVSNFTILRPGGAVLPSFFSMPAHQPEAH